MPMFMLEVGPMLCSPVLYLPCAVFPLDAPLPPFPCPPMPLLCYVPMQEGRPTHGEAVATYVTALGLNPGYAFAHLHLGVLKEMLACPYDAEAQYREAVNMDHGLIRCPI